MPTFYDRFHQCAQRWPDKVALEIQRRERMESYTYAELRQMAESIGRWLADRKYPVGTRIAILADNHPRWVAAYLGIIAAGCTTVPLDTALHSDQVVKLLRDSGSSLLFSDTKHLPIARDARETIPLELVLTDAAGQGSGSDLDSIFAAGSGDFTPLQVSDDDLACLIYTSGTTADPKGVMLTHANILGEVAAVFAWVDIGPDDALLGVLPLFHVLSQMANLLLPLVKGSRVVYLETLNTTELLRALQERQITAFAVVPQFFYLIHERIFKEIGKRGALTRTVFRILMAITRLARPWGWNPGKLFFGRVHKTFGGKMRYLVTGGSRFDPQIGYDFQSLGIDVLQAYGLTETSAAAFATSPEDNVIGSVGKPLPGVEARIFDPQPQDSGPPIGEIIIRGAIVMKGYWNRPDATEAVLKDGWFHTGDLGRFDENGNLFLTGRIKEVIVLSNGKNIYPEEIEAHYLQSAYIKEIAVLGLEGPPGNPAAERLHAVIVPNFDVLKERKVVNSKEVIRWDIEGLSAELASTKRIGSYEVWQQELPRTTTRKLKRFEIEKRARANQVSGAGDHASPAAGRQLSPEETAWLENADVQRALKVIREHAKTAAPVIRPGDNLELELGLDSMSRVELLVALEQEIGGDVEESRLGGIYTVGELVDAIRESAAGGKTFSRSQVGGWKAVLQEDPENPEVLALRDSGQLGQAGLYFLTRVVQLLARVFFRLRLQGLANLPARGPFILSSNHQSYLDPVILASVLPWRIFRAIFFVGTSEIFGSGPMRVLARSLRVVVLDPDANLIPAMRAGAFVLRNGRVLILYPEGERSIDGAPRIFKKGAAILATHLQVPIVPIAVEGFYQSWPRGKRFQRFAPLKISFGAPLQPPAQTEASEAEYEKFTVELKDRVVGMWDELRAKQGS
jgi:long-chain acyl-CoA synthetase